jgi:hypothetical protein
LSGLLAKIGIELINNMEVQKWDVNQLQEKDRECLMENLKKKTIMGVGIVVLRNVQHLSLSLL